MKRSTYKKRDRTGGIKHYTVLEGPDCQQHTQEGRFLQHQFLKIILETPDLSSCGGKMFEKMNMYHDGKRWKAELEAYEFASSENRYDLRTPQ